MSQRRLAEMLRRVCLRARAVGLLRGFAAALVAMLLAGACAKEREAAPLSSTTKPPDYNALQEGDDGPGYGRLTLALGLPPSVPAREAASETPPASATPLSPEEVEALLKSVPPASPPQKGLQPPPLPPLQGASPAAPPAAAYLQTLKPEEPSTNALVPRPVALTIVQAQPQGMVQEAREVRVEFSHPLREARAFPEKADVPVAIEPPVAGRWHWQSPQALVFEPATGAFAPDMRYRIAVSPGAISQLGGELAEERTWAFSTESLRVVESWPPPNATHDGPVVLAFNHAVDPVHILSHLRLRQRASLEGAARDVPLSYASLEAMRRNPELLSFVRAKAPGTWVAVEAGPSALPPETSVQLALDGAHPSAPLQAPQETRSAFALDYTTPPRAWEAIVQTGCPKGSSNPQCRRSMWRIAFNRPIAARQFDPDRVEVEPTLPGVWAQIEGSDIVLGPMDEAPAAVRIRIGAGLEDVFGHRMAEELVLDVVTPEGPPLLWRPDQPVETMPLHAPAHSAVWVRGLASVNLAAWPLDGPAARETMSSARPPETAGARVKRRQLPTGLAPGEFRAVALDLSPLLDSVARTHVVEIAAGEALGEGEAPAQAAPKPLTWLVHRTDLRTELVLPESGGLPEVWVTSLANGKPLQGVRLASFTPGRATGADLASTDAMGLAILGPLQGSALEARLGEDYTFVPAGNASGSARALEMPWRWQVADWQGTYTGREDVAALGWVVRGGPLAARTTPRKGAAPARLAWRLRDAQGGIVDNGVTLPSSLGAFELRAKNLAQAAHGQAHLEFDEADGGFSPPLWRHALQISNPRRDAPGLAVQSDHRTSAPGEDIMLSARALGEDGRPLTQTPVTWELNARAGTHVPPGHRRFGFGTICEVLAARLEDVPGWQGEGLTDERGAHRLGVRIGSGPLACPQRLSARLRLGDAKGGPLQASQEMLVHPSAVYVGLRPARQWMASGEAQELDILVVDPAGRPREGVAVDIFAVPRKAMLQSRSPTSDGTLDALLDREKSPPSCRAVTRPEGLASCRFVANAPGDWLLLARAHDASHRPALTATALVVLPAEGTTEARPPTEPRILAEQPRYAPGQQARLLTSIPTAPATAYLRLSGPRGVERHVLELRTHHSRHVFDVTEAHAPGMDVQLHIVPGPVDSKRAHPGGAFVATQRIPVDDPGRELALELSLHTPEAPQEPRTGPISPGQPAEVHVTVRDARGALVPGAQVAVGILDEDRLREAGHSPDLPWEAWASLPARTWWASDSPGPALSPARGEALALAEARLSGNGPPQERAQSTPPLSSGLEGARARAPAALALAPRLVTDALGQVRLPFAAADHAARYRIVVLAAASGERFGRTSKPLVVEQALRVQMPPLGPAVVGDRLELPLVVENPTREAQMLALAVRAGGARVEGPQGWRVPMEAGATVRLTATLEVLGDAAGGMDLEVIARLERGPATQVRRRVAVAAPEEEVAELQGILTVPAGRIAVQLPPGISLPHSRLDISLSPTPVPLIEAVAERILDVRCEDAEQLASQILGLLALGDLERAFGPHAGLGTPAQREALIGKAIDALEKQLARNGEGTLFSHEQNESAFVRLHAFFAMEQARRQGFQTPRELMAVLEMELHRTALDPAREQMQQPRSVVAYSLYIQRQLGRTNSGVSARALLEHWAGRNVSLDEAGWLLHALEQPADARAQRWWKFMGTDRLMTRLAGEVARRLDTGLAANTTEDGHTIQTHWRGHALAIEALRASKTLGHEALHAHVERLLAGRNAQGHWGSSQDNVFGLLAVRGDLLSRPPERAAVPVQVGLWLNERPVGAFSLGALGSRGAAYRLELGVLDTAPAPTAPPPASIVLSRAGQTPLYYRITGRFGLQGRSSQGYDEGFEVRRHFEALDHVEDVRRRADGTWEIRLGARVRVVLSVKSERRRDYVLVREHLGAGLLLEADSLPSGPLARETYWYSAVQPREDGLEVYSPTFFPGERRFSFVVRAQLPGRFLARGARAEELYRPGVRGVSAADEVLVSRAWDP